MLYGIFLSHEALVRGFPTDGQCSNSSDKAPFYLCPVMPSSDQRTQVKLVFALCCVAFCFAGAIFSFHVYLIITGQTTIEFLGSWGSKGQPYDQGYLRNWQAVYGTGPLLLSMLPSRREREFLPVPAQRCNSLATKDADT